jgi:hypothetical protein
MLMEKAARVKRRPIQVRGNRTERCLAGCLGEEIT